jgi:hypothetical protein
LILIDRGTHNELGITPVALCGPRFVNIVAGVLARFGSKPLLVVCDGPAESPAFFQAYDTGMRLAALVRARVAIVLGGREPADADRMSEQAARRGKDVRSFADLQAAKAWLAVD